MPTKMKVTLDLFLLIFLVPNLVLGANTGETFLRIERNKQTETDLRVTSIGGFGLRGGQVGHADLSYIESANDGDGLAMEGFDLAQLRANAERIYTTGMRSIMQEKVWNVGEIWVLKEILKLDHDGQLSQFVNDKVDKLSGDPFLRLVDPKAPLVALPEHPGLGRERFFTYMLAVVGTSGIYFLLGKIPQGRTATEGENQR